MDKQAALIIGVIGVVMALILYWIFGGEDNEAQKQEVTKPPVTNTTPSQEDKGNVTTQELTKSQNESIKAFAREFTEKYLNYNPSKPTAHVESLKTVMDPDLYNDQFNQFKTPNPNIKSIQIRKILITEINVGEWYNTLTVPIDVTVSTTQGQNIDATYIYIYNITQENKGWKMVGITDESDIHE